MDHSWNMYDDAAEVSVPLGAGKTRCNLVQAIYQRRQDLQNSGEGCGAKVSTSEGYSQVLGDRICEPQPAHYFDVLGEAVAKRGQGHHRHDVVEVMKRTRTLDDSHRRVAKCWDYFQENCGITYPAELPPVNEASH